MFCQNCGKKLPNDANFCEGCGLLVRSDDGRDYNDKGFSQQGTEQYSTNQDETNNTQNMNTQSAYDWGLKYASGENYEYNQYNTPHKDKSTKKLWNKGFIFAIVGVALAVIISITCFGIGVGVINRFIHRNDYRNHNAPFGRYDYEFDDDYGYFGNPRDQYDDFGDYNFGFGDGRGNGNNRPYGFGNGSGDGNIQSSPLPAEPLPTDGNGRLPSDNDYQWPTGDGQYEFYAKSTIPRFESVTGKNLVSEKVENDGNTYYTYDMDNDAYTKYIKVLEEKGFKQVKFEVEGKDSYVMHQNGNEYLEIYLINSQNQIVIMA